MGKDKVDSEYQFFLFCIDRLKSTNVIWLFHFMINNTIVREEFYIGAQTVPMWASRIVLEGTMTDKLSFDSPLETDGCKHVKHMA